MPVSEVSICNMALSWLGGNLITADKLNEEDSTEARLCAANYDLARDAVLENGDWTFAMKRNIPNLKSQPPEFGYASAFTLPPDCLRVVQVAKDPKFGDLVSDWVKEGNEILINNAEVIYIRYVFRLTAPSLFSPNFIHTLAARIAADICVPLTTNAELYTYYWNMYLDKLANAENTDGLQGVNQPIRANMLTKLVR